MRAETLALLGGDPVVGNAAARYPRFDSETLSDVSRLLQKGPMQGLSKGHRVIRDFEEAFAAYHAVPHCLAASSGHGALQSALIGLEITAGDHVLTSPYSWGASVSCILHNGAVPVFADVDTSTGLLDPEKLDDYRTPDTTAILVPHLYGQPADMTALVEYARARGLRLIEDGSQAHGAKHRGRRVGSFGDAAGFSINGVKPIATTEGGYLVTPLAEVYWKATISCQHAGRGELLGRASEEGFPEELRPYIDSLVYTYRPNCVAALLAIDRLHHLEAENECRREHAREFLAGIDGIECLSSPEYAAEDECVHHMLTLNFDEERAGVGRDLFLEALQAEGVPAVRYVEKPLNRSPRLSPDWRGPRVMWTEAIRRSGLDPTRVVLPGCEQKVARSIELPWNYARPQSEIVDRLASAFHKVTDGIDQLRLAARSGQVAGSRA